MTVVRTKHFEATSQQELEGSVNTFLATLPLAMVMDVQISAVHGQTSRIRYLAMVIYQG